MSRLFLLVAVIVVIYLLLKSFRRNVAKPDEQAKPEDMVQCAHCGVHLPRSESLLHDGAYYCSALHRDDVKRRD